MNSSIKKLENAKVKIQKKNNSTPEQDTRNQETIKYIVDRIKEIKAIRYKCLQDIAKANWRIQGEVINKFWCATGKEKKGCYTIMELKYVDSSPPRYTTNSIEMSCEMAKHHTNVQKIDMELPENTRKLETTKLLTGMPKINESDALDMAKDLEHHEIALALTESPNNKAPGLNSIPTELYKTLHK